MINNPATTRLRLGSAADRWLGLRAWIRPGCTCPPLVSFVFSRCHCDGLIPFPERFYRLWRVIACDIETSRIRRPWPTLDFARQKMWSIKCNNALYNTRISDCIIHYKMTCDILRFLSGVYSQAFWLLRLVNWWRVRTFRHNSFKLLRLLYPAGKDITFRLRVDNYVPFNKE
jgi:hypothetical protein